RKPTRVPMPLNRRDASMITIDPTVEEGVDLQLLGGFRVRLAAGRDIEIRRRKAQALLAYVSLHPGQRILRDTLAGLLWGGVSDEQARHNLRQALFMLRCALPSNGSVLITDSEAITLLPDAVTVDVVTFRRLAGQTRPEALCEAAALYVGPL